MNWSTRLRRWVRIRTPPVRVASMKPTAATVLPAPVACSNQKRRAAPGSSGASSTDLLVLARPAAPPSPGAPRRRRAPRPPPRLVVLVVVELAVVLVGGSARLRVLGLLALRWHRRRPPFVGAPTCCSAISSVRVPESASTWCGFSSAPSRSFGGSSASSAPARAAARSRGATRSRGPRRPRRARSARRRGRGGGPCPGASASGPSPSSRKGSRANAAARSMSALEGTAAGAATSLVLAMKASGFRPRSEHETCRRGNLDEDAGRSVFLLPGDLSGSA